MPSFDTTFNGHEVRVNGRSWRVPYPIRDIRRVGEMVALIYEYTAGPRHRQFQNLEGFDLAGRRLWTAEHATSETTDVYVNFLERGPLSAWSFACYVCVLDPRTGRLLSAEFTK